MLAPPQNSGFLIAPGRPSRSSGIRSGCGDSCSSLPRLAITSGLSSPEWPGAAAPELLEAAAGPLEAAGASLRPGSLYPSRVTSRALASAVGSSRARGIGGLGRYPTRPLAADACPPPGYGRRGPMSLVQSGVIRALGSWPAGSLHGFAKRHFPGWSLRWPRTVAVILLACFAPPARR